MYHVRFGGFEVYATSTTYCYFIGGSNIMHSGLNTTENISINQFDNFENFEIART